MSEILERHATRSLAREPRRQNSSPAGSGRERFLTASSIIGAVLASSCCIVPLALVTFGVSGVWIGSLTALEPYRPYIIAATVIALGAGFRQVYTAPKKVCAEGSYCASPTSDRVTKSVLWTATVLVLAAATVDYWAPILY